MSDKTPEDIARGTYTLRIDAFTPETIRMDRLAEYMAEMPKLLGDPNKVRFGGVTEGSLEIHAHFARDAIPADCDIVANAFGGNEAAVRAYDALDRLLDADNAVGAILSPDRDELIAFQGRNRPKPIELPSLREDATVEGELVRIGGKDHTVHATLVDGPRKWRCVVDRGIARKMAQHLFGAPLRVHGSGKWNRTESGVWELSALDVRTFEVLESRSLLESVQRLRALDIGELRGEGAHRRMIELRGDPGKPN